jgi:hypothetical protein
MSTLLDHDRPSLTSASARLQELRKRMLAMGEWCLSLLVLGGVLWLVGSTHLAIAVATGAVAAVVIGGLAFDERRRMVLTLVAQGDATSIPEVRALAHRLTHDPAERHRLAGSLRTAARSGRGGARAPMVVASGRVAAYAPRLLALADAIEDPRRTVTAASVALCRTLLCDGANSPLYNPNLSERELDRVLRAVEAGIAPPTMGREARPVVTPGHRSAAS